MPDDWTEYRRLILGELERLNGQVETINRKLDQIGVDIAMLKVKASLFGALGGAVISAIVSRLVK